MGRSLTPYLQLVRLPNVFTAAADSLAGWLLVGGRISETGRWIPLCLASMSLYAAGMALNDWFDREIDRIERPARPILSGRVPSRSAAFIGVGGLILGPFLAAAAGAISSLWVAGVLALMILAYDWMGKRTIFGPAIMGTCRGLNLLLGMSQSSSLGGQTAWLAAVSFGLFVAGLTWISRSETETGRRNGLLVGLTIQDIALLLLAAVTFQARSFPQPDLDRPLIPLEGLLVLALVGLAVNQAATRAIYDPGPLTIQPAVKVGILSLIWIDVALVAAVRGPGPAAMVGALWLPAYFLGRWLYST